MRKLSGDELQRKDLASFRSSRRLPVCFLLDNIRSGWNIGSVFRIADCFSLDHLVLGGITACPPNREVEKTALGATASVPWKHVEDLPATLKHYQQEGWAILAVEQTDVSVSLSAFRFQPEQKYLFVFGNEVRGISEECLSCCDAAIEIPQFGTKHSLNVSTCAGIIAWELARAFRLG